MTFLFDQGAATLAELTVAKERRNRAQMDYDSALYDQNQYYESRTNDIDIPEARRESERNRISAQLKAVEEQRLRLSQVVSQAGRVLDIFTTPGESLAAGAPIILLGRSNRPSIVAYLAPKYAKYARTGRSATVKLPDGRTLEAVVAEDAHLTKRLPANLSSPIGSRDLMLLVNLSFLTPLPPIQWVDGLPVTVRFSF
jgi:multidrug resistance efflux pump